MGLQVSIPKKRIREYLPSDIAELKGLSCGVTGCRPVLEEGVEGAPFGFTRLYEPGYMGESIELTQDDEKIYLEMDFPAGLYDIDLFFRLIRETCILAGTDTFSVDEEECGVEETEELIAFFTEESKRALKEIQEQIEAGTIDGHVAFGTRIPVVIGKEEIKEINGDIYNFGFLMDRLQRVEATYSSPGLFARGDGDVVEFYDFYPDRKYIVPRDPEFLLLEDYRISGWYVVLDDSITVKYDDFINNLRKAEYFDMENILICLDEDEIDYLGRNFGYNPRNEEYESMPYWGQYVDCVWFHGEKVNQKNLDIDYIAGCNHIAAYLRWCGEHDLLSDELKKEFPELMDLILENKTDLREIICDHPMFRGELATGHFNQLGREFTKQYYKFGGEDTYPMAIDDMSNRYFEGQDVEECQTEEYMYIPYDEAYYEMVAPYIESKWKEFLNNRE